MPLDDAPPSDDAIDGSEDAVPSSQLSWWSAHREVAIEALSALAHEPLTRLERQRLDHLLHALQPGPVREDSGESAAVLSARLSSRELAWLPVLPLGGERLPAQAADGVGDASSSAAQMLVGVVRAIDVPSRAIAHVAVIYPLIVLAFSMLVLIGLCGLVVPPFEAMFDDFGLALPLPTQWLIALSRLFRVGPLLWLAGSLLVVVIGFVIYRSRTSLTNLRLRLGLRQRGNRRELLAISHFARDLAELLQANTTPAEAIRLAAVRCEHPYLRRTALGIAADAQHGLSALRQDLGPYRLPTNLIFALSGGGKAAGRPNIPLLLTLADLYEERAAGRTEIATTTLGLVTVVVIGMFVGLTALALFLPLIALISGLS